uniref:NADH-ubiquinone oxidoreductase chain 4 n=1 Tax=Stictocephala bisonia TaxID=1585304 RepID=A0A894JP21_9HEMI|nr:NADH dehydrogenase subunit 4 [Stictocephala bisonia]QRV59925.1 NADH dehydrogenase subunit 4 [Stictocephala bisonia]
MMMVILYLSFMIPLLVLDFWFIFQFFLILCLLIFITLSYSDYFCSVSYFFGIDYFSYCLIILSIFISFLMLMSSSLIFNSISRWFFVLNCFLLCFFLILVFSFLNMIFMYISFELTLIPLLIIILGWGYQPERLISSFYLFFYTLFGSLPLFFFIIYIYMNNSSVFFDFNYFFDFSFFIHFCMMFAFLIKLPMFMLHFWLPSAHVQAPVSGSMILAGLMLKIGGYGLIRFMFIYDYFFFKYTYFWFSLSLYGSLIVSVICFLQSDLKCLIAYSSVCHMGLCLCGLLTMTSVGLIGSLFMMISHGLCSSGLFFLANCLYDRLFTRSFFLNKGMVFFFPSLSLIWFIFCSFNMSCPPSLNFFSEVFIIIGVLSYWPNSYFFMIMISFLSACFSFYLYSYTQHGLFSNLYSFSLMSVREYLISLCHLLPLLILVFFMMLI